MEEENKELIDNNASADMPEQESSEDDVNDDSMETLKVRLEEIYRTRLYFIDIINQTNNRHVNLALIITQFFSRYSVTQIIAFLLIASGIVVLQGTGAFTGTFANSNLFLGALMTVVMIAFVVITLKNIISALIDIRRLKRGFGCLGYQIVYNNNDNEKTSSDPSSPPLIAYKDNVNMIRTLAFPKEPYKRYFMLPVLILFLDCNNPYKVTFFDDLPRDISYENKTQSFTQEWTGALYALVPIAMTVLFIISLYLSRAAITLNQ